MDGTSTTNRMWLESLAIAKPRIARWTRVLHRTTAGRTGFTVFALALLFAVNLLLRFLWLDRLPGINGDEAWYGVQALRWVNGLDWSARTPSGLVVNPLLLFTEAGLLLIAEPSFWILRLPVAIWGVLSIWITYRLHRWVYHNAIEAWSVAALTACLPAHLAHSRFCWDASFAFVSFPLVLYPFLKCMAGDRSLKAIALFCLGAVLTPWIHATHAIVLVAAALVVLWEHRRAVTGWMRRRPAASAIAAVLCIFAAARLIDESRAAAILWESIESSLPRLPRHLSGLAGVLWGSRVFEYLSGWPGVGLDLVLVPLFYACAAWGLYVLAQSDRSSDRRLAVFTVCVVCLVLLAGRALRLHRASYERYILYMVPLGGVVAARVLWLGCGTARSGRMFQAGDVVRRWSVANGAPRLSRAPAARDRFAVGLCTIGFVLLAYSWHAYFSPLGRQTYADRQHRTFWSGAVEPKAAVARAIQELSGTVGGGAIHVEDWWIEHPLRYLLGVRYDVRSNPLAEESTGAPMVVGFRSSPFTAALRDELEGAGRRFDEAHFTVGETGAGLVLFVIRTTPAAPDWAAAYEPSFSIGRATGD